jgi:hypothetical protein
MRALTDLVQFTALAFKPRQAIVAENLILRCSANIRSAEPRRSKNACGIMIS